MFKYIFSERISVRNPVAKDLRTPKYRQRSESPKKRYNRKLEKRMFQKEIYECE